MEKQLVSSALCSRWCLAEQLHSGMGSSWDLWFHYGAIPFPRERQQTHHSSETSQNITNITKTAWHSWLWNHGVICDFQSASLVLSSCSCFPNGWHRTLLGSQSLYISDCCKGRNFLLHAAVWELQCVALDGFPSPLIVSHEQHRVGCGTAPQNNPWAVPSSPESGDWENITWCSCHTLCVRGVLTVTGDW